MLKHVGYEMRLCMNFFLFLKEARNPQIPINNWIFDNFFWKRNTKEFNECVHIFSALL